MTGLAESVRRRRRGGIDRDTKKATENFIGRTTTLRGVDLGRLGEGQQREMVALVHKVTEGLEGGANFTRLGVKETLRYEALLERAGNLKPGTLAAERDAASLRTRAAALARRAARLAVPTPQREQAFLGLLGQHLRDGILHVEHLALLTAVLGQLFNGESLAPGSSITGSGDSLTLTVDHRYGIVGADRDEDSLLTRWEETLQHLGGVNRYLDVERDGPTYRIRLGSRTRRALWGQS